MESEDFQRLVAETVKSLPRDFRDRIKNVEFIVTDYPEQEILEKLGKRSPLYLLGLYQGIPLKRRGAFYGNVLPDRIIIYQKPIERMCKNDEEIRRKVREVVLHEIGHYFGLSEDELRRD